MHSYGCLIVEMYPDKCERKFPTVNGSRPETKKRDENTGESRPGGIFRETKIWLGKPKNNHNAIA